MLVSYSLPWDLIVREYFINVCKRFFNTCHYCWDMVSRRSAAYRVCAHSANARIPCADTVVVAYLISNRVKASIKRTLRLYGNQVLSLTYRSLPSGSDKLHEQPLLSFYTWHYLVSLVRMSNRPSTWRFWTCSIEGCFRASAIDLGSCERCLNHYCVMHLDSPLHTCKVSLNPKQCHA